MPPLERLAAVEDDFLVDREFLEPPARDLERIRADEPERLAFGCLKAMPPAKARKMGLSESTNQQGKKKTAAQIRLGSRYCAGKGRTSALRTLVVPGSRRGKRVRPLIRSISSMETANTWKSRLLSLSLGIK